MAVVVQEIGTSAMLRAFNERRVVNLIAADGPISRAQIARACGLSKPTVSLALARLEEQRLVRETGRTSGGRGATAVLYSIEPDAGYALAFDVGRRWVRAALIDVSGAVRARLVERTRLRPATAVIHQLSSMTDELVADAGIDRRRLVAATFATPGIVSPEGRSNRIELAPSLPALGRAGALDDLRAAIGVDLVTENDVNAAAMAELTYGVGRQQADFAYVSLGTGVGAALVLGGRLRRGASGAAGEIGYVPVPHPRDAASPTVEGNASADALVRHARAAGLTTTAAEDVVQAARDGNPAALDAVDSLTDALAIGIAAVVVVADPGLVVLGGGLGLGAADLLIPRLHSRLRLLLPLRVEIVPSGLTGDAVLDGALAATLLTARDIVFGSTPLEER